MLIVPIILCGGAGSRLWPVSREMYPKPFIQLKDGQNFLQKTFLRAKALPTVKEIVTVTNKELFFIIQESYKEINAQGVFTSFILEPVAKNTAAAIAAAALYVHKKYGEKAILLMLAADHLIENQKAFQNALEAAAGLALENQLLTFGIQPTHPETGYGYIEIGQSFLENTKPYYPVKSFVEKPSLDLAEKYIASGRYLWNSGIFCFTAAHVLAELHQFCPDILNASKACVEQSVLEESEQQALLKLHETTFNKVPENSFDYAVMEPASKNKNAKIAVVPCDMGWRDIGSWGALQELAEPDAAGNVIDGDALLYDTKNCYVQSRHHLVSMVGVDNLVVIDTPDALLIVDKKKTQDVKHLYAHLKAKDHETYKHHRTIYRPWGKFTVLEEGPQFKIKRLEVNPGAGLSLQMHHHRNEHWIVVSGMARVINGEREELIATNESTYIPAGNRHRLENPGILPLVLIEVQSGQYLGEDDIVRFEDNYGRV